MSRRLGLTVGAATVAILSGLPTGEASGSPPASTEIGALGEELARYAQAHGGALPGTLDPVLSAAPPTAADCGLVYRPVPELGTDGRLILAYDDEARHPMMAFPRVGAGRNVLFASGRVELFEEQAVHQLIVGDNVLRDRLGLPELPFLEVTGG